MAELSDLIEFATPRQREILEAIEKHGSQRKAAKAMGMNKRSVERSVERVKAVAARRGWSPEHDMVKPAAPGFAVKGTSTLYTNGEGGTKIAAQWVKTTQDAEKQAAMMRDAIDALREEIPPTAPTDGPAVTNADLLNLYVITDYHLGMLAWAEETGDDWDMTIAEDLLVRWFAQAIKQSPDAETAYFAQIGDFLHFDGLEAVTPESRHILDADTRFSKLVRVAIRALRRVIAMLLEKHQHVHLLMADANHDPSSSVWLREFFAALYEQEPRISVELSPDTYYCHEHGKTSLFFHHGHKRKPTNIHSVFAAKFREVFGRTKYSYGHMGHLHHIDVKESELMIVEQHRTLAANDAYASRGGWISGRSSSVITYSKKFGEVSRITISPDMVKAA